MQDWDVVVVHGKIEMYERGKKIRGWEFEWVRVRRCIRGKCRNPLEDNVQYHEVHQIVTLRGNLQDENSHSLDTRKVGTLCPTFQASVER